MGPSKVIRPIDFRLTGTGPSTLVSGPSTLAVYSHGGVGFGRLESNTAETSHRRTRQLLGKAHTAPSVFFFFLSPRQSSYRHTLDLEERWGFLGSIHGNKPNNVSERKRLRKSATMRSARP